MVYITGKTKVCVKEKQLWLRKRKTKQVFAEKENNALDNGENKGLCKGGKLWLRKRKTK